MTVETSRLSEYTAEGPANPSGPNVARLAQYVTEGGNNLLYTSRLSSYLVEGGNNLLYTSRMSLYVVEGPPVIIPPAPRRRQTIMP